MDDEQISEKIQALKLELARKQRKLMKLNKLSLKKSLRRENSTSPLKLNGSTLTPRIPSEPNILNSKPVLNSEDGRSISTSHSANSGEEELFPDDVQELPVNKDFFQASTKRKENGDVEGKEDIHTVESEQRTVETDVNGNHRSLEKSSNCVEAVNGREVSPLSPIIDSTMATDPSKTCEVRSSRRRSSRIFSKAVTITNSALKNEKPKLDLQSVVCVTFEILCQMGKNVPMEDFSLPDNEFNMVTPRSSSSGVSNEQTMVLQKDLYESTDNVCKVDTRPSDAVLSELCFSENMVPPTLAPENMNFFKERRHSFFQSKASCKANSALSTTYGEKSSSNRDCSESVVSLNEVNTKDTLEGEKRSPMSLPIEKDAEKIEGKRDKNGILFRHNSQEINTVCESVINDMIGLLDISTENTQLLKHGNNSVDSIGDQLLNVRSVCATHYSQGLIEDEPGENVILSSQNEKLIAFIQKRKSICMWEEHEDVWLQVHTYTAQETEEIHSFTVFDSNLAVLVKGNHFQIRVLKFNQNGICLQSEISLGSQSRAAVSGILGTLEPECVVSSCLSFEGYSQLEVHTIKPSHPTNTVYFEPPNESILGAVVSVLGLPNALMGLGAHKLYFWNISTGLLVRTVVLSHEKENHFEKCIWAKFEKGLLFGVLKEIQSQNWTLVVINPATGQFNKLCCYSCPTCQESPSKLFPRHSFLLGKVECHKLLSICCRRHLTVFDLLSGEPLVVSKEEGTRAASLNANILVMSNSDGSASTFKISKH